MVQQVMPFKQSSRHPDKSGVMACYYSIILTLTLGAACCCGQSIVGLPTNLTSLGPPVTPLYNTTYNGTVLQTVCPCKASWNFTKGDGSTVLMTGCANPDNSVTVRGVALTAGPVLFVFV